MEFDEAHMGEKFSDGDLRDLGRAKALLENPGLTARLSSVIGAPLERGLTKLPPEWSGAIQRATHAALMQALEVAVATLKVGDRGRTSNLLHKVLVGASGGIGGAFGLPAMMVELPVSTTLILRSIADIAHREGHDIRNIFTKLSCLEVFALGGRSKDDDGSESAYWAVRAGMSKAVSEAGAYFAKRGILEKGAPAIVRFVGAITSRFGIVVSEQLAAKALPVIGAAGGSVINVLFMNHFQDMARGHFIVKRLEAKYGVKVVQEMYETLGVPHS